jgi:glycerol kinase
MDLRRRDWDPELLELFQIPHRLLPPVRPGLFPAGELRLRGSSLRITATLGDQQAALIGLGCRQAGDLALNYGTGAFAILNTGKRARRIPGLLTSVAWSAPGEVRYLLEGTVNSAGSALEWLRRMSGSNGKSLARGWRQAEVPLVVPSFSGLGAPHWMGRARGAMLDLDLATGPEDLAAGIVAGIALRIGEIVDAMRRGGIRLRRIVAGGGLAEQTDLLSLQAALLGRAIERSSIAEGSCRGVALLAGRADGELDLGGDRLWEYPMKRVAPGVSSSQARRFTARFRRARSLVEDLAAGE